MDFRIDFSISVKHAIDIFMGIGVASVDGV
jgi:hypothetical protein